MDPARDLRAVVSLLSDAFGQEVHLIGPWVFRGMRVVAWLSPFLGTWVFGPGVYGRVLMAFVWQEHGQVVGHASVQRLDRWGREWHIANVAVAAPYRNRGIGRRLMEAALDFIREHGGVWALLQVRANNAPAVHLYRTLGFDVLGGHIRWRAVRQEDVSSASRLSLQPLRWHHASVLRDLMHRALSEEERWWREKVNPFTSWVYEMGNPTAGVLQWLRLGVYGWYGLWEQGRLVAALGLRGDRWRRKGRLSVWVDHRFWGRWESELVQEGVWRLCRAGIREIHTRTDAHHAALTEALRAAGFEVMLHLLNMRCRVEGGA